MAKNSLPFLNGSAFRNVLNLGVVALFCSFSIVAFSQESEAAASEQFHRIQFALKVLDGSVPFPGKETLSVGGIEIPNEALQLMRIARSANIDLSPEQTRSFGQAKDDYVFAVSDARFRFKNDPDRLKEVEQNLREKLITDTREVLSPLQTRKFANCEAFAMGLPKLIVSNGKSWGLAIDKSDQETISRNSSRIAEELEKKVAEAKKKAVEDFLDSLDPQTRKALGEKLDLQEYHQRLEKMPAEILIYQMRQSVRHK